MTLTHEPHTATWDTDLSLGNLRSGLSAFPTGVVALAGLADGVPEVMVSFRCAPAVRWRCWTAARMWDAGEAARLNRLPNTHRRRRCRADEQ